MVRVVLLDRARTSLRLRGLDFRDRYLTHPPRADRLTPPRRMNFVGVGDFVDTGDEFLGHFVTLAALQPGDRVLDVGCGIGRIARPLAAYLDASGSYDGFDVNAEGIAWCREHYAPYPNFRFAVADLHNRRYNPGGTQTAAEFRFPYGDASFDLVVLTSVFTHLLPPETDHYLAEIARVLAPGGRVFATFFLLDDEARDLIARGVSAVRFDPAADEAAVLDPEIPEEAVAYADAWIVAALERHGLEEAGRYPGSWCGRPVHVSGQDIVVARRRGGAAA
jgi:SAM-dependent methyltransferase